MIAPDLWSRLGWLKDPPDVRDYTDTREGLRVRAPAALPARVDLRRYCSAIEDQGQLGSCTAQAAVGLYEAHERRVRNRDLDLSRLFVYKVTRNLMGVTGDTGAYLRTTMGSLRLAGACPESFWPHKIARFDVEPGAFQYSLAQAYQAVTYYRLDPAGRPPGEVLLALETRLAAQQMAMFGFTVYSSILSSEVERTGRIPYPSLGDSVLGGHAVVAVGYDLSTEHLLIRNSWGTGWGEAGYGWLPFGYVLAGLASDFWCLTKAEWADVDGFLA